MDAIDGKAPARLRAAGDAGSGSAARAAREGTVRELVHHVALLSAEHRAGAVLELADGRTLELAAILELAAREDLGD